MQYTGISCNIPVHIVNMKLKLDNENDITIGKLRTVLNKYI
jgi:hypothetical protein